MGKRNVRRWNRGLKALSFGLVCIIAVSMTGCGGKAGDMDNMGQGGAKPGSGDELSESVAMGRYVETMTEVDTGPIMDLIELSDGRMALLEDGAEGRWISEDGGASWQPDALPGWMDLVMENYISDMKAAPDGSVAILYERYSSLREKADGGEEESEEEEQSEIAEEEEQSGTAEEESEEGEQSGTEEEEPEEEEQSETAEEEPEAGEERPEDGICLLSSQGKVQWIELPVEEGENVHALCFSEDGARLFAASSEQKIYEVDQGAGTAKLLMTADIMPDMFCVWENYMALKSQTDGVMLYDLAAGERLEDDVFADFVKENCTVEDIVMSSTYSIFPAEEGGLYLACHKGVYRHAVGGTVMEQVINGGLCSLSDPMRHVAKMIRTAEGGFMTAFSEGKLSAFTYDPNIAATPSQRLTAYSLTENDILRQAIISYQGKYPDVYVEYKVGMEEEGGGTREDAVKKLNTELMAGKGPDLLILDGLPVDSYLDKGVLADLTPLLSEMEKEEKLLANIKESFLKDGKIYMMPAGFTLSMYMTDAEYMTEVSDFSDLADMFEKMRKEHPGEGIMETYSEEMLLDALMPVSAPLWMTETGEMNTEEMSAYLEQAKRIYDACMEGLPEELLKKYRDRAEGTVGSSDEVSAYNDLQGGGIQIAVGNEKVTLGELRNAYNYAFLQSVRRVDGKEDLRNYASALTPGRVADGFRPLALLGINAASNHTDLTGGLLREIFSKETQRTLYPAGFPVNEAGLSDYLDSLGGRVPEDMQEPGEQFGGYGFTDEDGLVISFGLYMPTKEERDELYQMLTSVRTPYLSDVVVEDAVREAGIRYLEDRCSLEEALEGIQAKLAIYMAE